MRLAWTLAFALIACSGWHSRPYVGLGYVDGSDISMQSDRSPVRSESGDIDGRAFAFLMWEPKRGFERDWPYWGNVPFYPAHMPQQDIEGPTEPQVDPEIAGTDSEEPESQVPITELTVDRLFGLTLWQAFAVLVGCIGLTTLVWGLKGFPGIRRKGS